MSHHHWHGGGSADFFPGGDSGALNDGHTVAIGVPDEAPDRLPGTQRLLVNDVQRHFWRALRRRSRHVGLGLGAPDAPELPGILLVAALEPAIENLDGDVLLVSQSSLHRALDQRV